MKIAKIVEQTKEHGRLQGLIDEIQTALDVIEKSKHPKPEVEFTSNWFTLLTPTTVGWEDTVSKEYVSFSLSANVTDLIKSDLEKILRAKLVELMKQQDSLEV